MKKKVSNDTCKQHLWLSVKCIKKPLKSPHHFRNPFSCLKDCVIKRKEASSFSVATAAVGSEKSSPSPHGWSHDSRRNSCFCTETYRVGVPEADFSTSGQYSNNGICSIYEKPKDFLTGDLQELDWTGGSRE